MICPNCKKDHDGWLGHEDTSNAPRRGGLCLECRHSFTSKELDDVKDLDNLRKQYRRCSFPNNGDDFCKNKPVMIQYNESGELHGVWCSEHAPKFRMMMDI